jgi:DNA-binding transcriptional MerR regulator
MVAETEKKKCGIGEVQEILREEFPDITISKIRFLEKEGLVKPERTQSGYRKYTRANIKQLSYVLRLQREEYLPLSVIKRKIHDLESGKVRAGDLNVMAGHGGEHSLDEELPVSVELAPSKLGLSPETISELVEFDIVKVSDGVEGKCFEPEDLKILGIAREFSRHGVEPRHLRMFTQFVGREAALIEQIVRPQFQRKDPNARRNAVKDVENLLSLCQMLSKALLNRALEDYLPRHARLEMPKEEKTQRNIEPGVSADGGGDPETGNHMGNTGVAGQEMFPE